MRLAENLSEGRSWRQQENWVMDWVDNIGAALLNEAEAKLSERRIFLLTLLAVLKLFYLTGASLNICKWLCNACLLYTSDAADE